MRTKKDNGLPFRNYRDTIPQKMTPEMWAVYRIIEENTILGETTSVAEICEKVPYYVDNKGDRKYSNCPNLYDDIFLINTLYRGEHDKYIITNSNKMKLATKEEVHRRYAAISSKYYKLNAEIQALDELIANNGQYKFYSNQGEEMSPHTKPYKESYSDK